MPVTMDVAKNWAVTNTADPSDERLMLCTVAGNNSPDVGFMDIQLHPAGDPRKALEKYLAARGSTRDKIEYRDTTVGQRAGVEATGGHFRAFAISTSSNALLLNAYSVDQESFLAFALPAYLLAKNSAVVIG